ncbi:MAG: nucleoside deaminase [Bacteroidales bacterium]|nr:nucleoside deaminase [Bacteroidales bacterium]
MLNLFTDEYFMKVALKEAETAFAEGEIPVGAVVVCNEQIVAKAHNQTERLNDVTAHAEMLALTAASNALGSKYLKECTLYVTLEPCTMCAGAAYWTQVGRLVYGATDEKRGYSLLEHLVLHPTTLIKTGVLQEESSALLQQFFKLRRPKKS